MNGREIDDVEAERCEAREREGGAEEGAVARRIGGLGSGKELVPRRERRALAIHPHLELARIGGEIGRRVVVIEQRVQLRIERDRDALGPLRARVANRERRGTELVARVAEARAPGRRVDELSAFEKLGRYVLPRANLFLELAPPRAEAVGPRFDRVCPPSHTVDLETTNPLVGVLLVDHGNGAPLCVGRAAVANAGGEEVVTVLENVGANFEGVANDALDGIASRIELRADAFDHHRSGWPRCRDLRRASSGCRGSH